jgi:hypothetical protein
MHVSPSEIATTPSAQNVMTANGGVWSNGYLGTWLSPWGWPQFCLY